MVPAVFTAAWTISSSPFDRLLKNRLPVRGEPGVLEGA